MTREEWRWIEKPIDEIRGVFVYDLRAADGGAVLIPHGAGVFINPERARLIAAAPDLLAALEAVEWVDNGNQLACPWCDGEVPHKHFETNGVGHLIVTDVGGHAPDCPRQLALAKAKAAE